MAKKQAAATQKPLSKSQVVAGLAEASGLTKKQVGAVLDALSDMVGTSVGKRGPGVFSLPGLVKIKVVRKPAVPARMGINRFTGEETMFKAKPARNVVKVQALKALKDKV